jgi:hypothetical protein
MQLHSAMSAMSADNQIPGARFSLFYVANPVLESHLPHHSTTC